MAIDLLLFREGFTKKEKNREFRFGLCFPFLNNIFKHGPNCPEMQRSFVHPLGVGIPEFFPIVQKKGKKQFLCFTLREAFILKKSVKKGKLPVCSDFALTLLLYECF